MKLFPRLLFIPFLCLWGFGVLWLMQVHCFPIDATTRLLNNEHATPRDWNQALADLSSARQEIAIERKRLSQEFENLLREKGHLRDREANLQQSCKEQRPQVEIDYETTNIFGNAGPPVFTFAPAMSEFLDKQKQIMQKRHDLPREQREWRPQVLKFRDDPVHSCKQNPQQSCNWATSEAFFQFESSAPQISDADLKRLTFLLVDQHGGPLLDTLGYLLNLGVPRSNIKTFCGNGPHCSPQDTDSQFSELHKYFTSPGLGTWEHGHDHLAEVQANITALGLPHFDVMICLYPGFQCAMARPLSTHLIVRPTNRWQEGLQNIPPRQKPTSPRLLHWAAILRKMGSCGNMALSASNAYDWLLFKHDLGVDALPWPSLALNEFPQVSDLDSFVPAEPKSQDLLYTHLQPYFSDQYSGLMMWYLLDASGGGRDFKLHHAHFFGRNFRDYAAVLIFPYNLQVTKFVEYYMAGIPLICPSLRLFTQWHYQYNVCFHRTTGYLPNNDYLSWDYSAYPESDGSPCCGVNSLRKEDAYWWLPMADFYHWPNVTYFDSWSELREAFLKIRDDKAHRLALIQGMMQYKKMLFRRSSTVLRAQLQAMLEAEKRGDVCTKFGILDV